jgi:hypothetical protein
MLTQVIAQIGIDTGHSATSNWKFVCKYAIHAILQSAALGSKPGRFDLSDEPPVKTRRIDQKALS